MRLCEVGKVLFVDDDYRTIEDTTSAFLAQGIEVQYWNGEGALPASIYNVRIVITDLDVEDSDMKEALGDNFYIPLIRALEKIPGPFMVILVAREFKNKDPTKLRRMYEKTVGFPFPGIIARKGLTKAELRPDQLKKLIESVLAKNELFDLMLMWEEIFDKAKDAALNEITTKNVKTSIRSLIKLLCYDCHETKGATRELFDEMARLVSRRTGQKEDLDRLAERIKAINKPAIKKKKKFLSKEDCLLLNKLIFYTPSNEEDVMTGDIFETTEQFKYAIVLTPKCDLMQCKTEKVLVCYAFPLKKSYFRNKNYPPHKNDPQIVKLHTQNCKMNEISKGISRRYLIDTSPESLPILWNFSAKDQGICLDLNNVQSVELANLRSWKRVSRIDSPYIEDILHRYGSLVSRIGTPDINHSPSQLQAILEKIEKKTSLK